MRVRVWGERGSGSGKGEGGPVPERGSGSRTATNGRNTTTASAGTRAANTASAQREGSWMPTQQSEREREVGGYFAPERPVVREFYGGGT